MKIHNLKNHSQDKIQEQEYIYLDCSSKHTSNVAYILNPKTDHISLQYHLTYDDDFATFSAKYPQDNVKIWEDLKKTQSKLEFMTQLTNKDKFEPDEQTPRLHIMALDITRSRGIVVHILPI